MRILFTRFPLESAYGGAEIQTLSLMEGLRKNGHDVSFLGSCPTLLSACKERDIKATRLDIGAPPVTKTGAVSFLWRQRKMKQELLAALEKTGPIDVIVMLSLTEKILVTDWASSKGIKILWIEHDRLGQWLTSNPWLPMLRKQAKNVTTVCVSQLSKRLYLDLGWPQNKTVAIPNGIDLQKFSSQLSVISHQLCRIGTIARLSREKGLDVLIDAVASIEGMPLTIIGKGREESVLRTRIHELRCDDRITIEPNTSDIPAFYRSLDVFVLPSRDHDPFGLVAAEAMASGTATIVTDACGIADELTHGTDALIVRAGNTKDLSAAIEILANDPAKRKNLADAGRRTANEKFGLSAMIAAYEHLL